MSHDSFNQPTVPYYCSSDTPRVRFHPREIPEFVKERKAQLMQARKFVWQWIKEYWKPGDRFVVCSREEMGEFSYFLSYAGRSGTFLEMKSRGVSQPYMIFVRWDDTGKAEPPIGVFNFYHFCYEPFDPNL